MEPTPEQVKVAVDTPGIQAVDALVVIASVHGCSLDARHSPPNSPLQQAYRAMRSAELSALKGETK